MVVAGASLPQSESGRRRPASNSTAGTGARPGLPEQMAAVTRLVNDDVRGAARVVAVDVPTGVDATTGEADDGAIRAHVTVTLGSPKRGCFVPPGNRYAGKIVVIDLG